MFKISTKMLENSTEIVEDFDPTNWYLGQNVRYFYQYVWDFVQYAPDFAQYVLDFDWSIRECLIFNISSKTFDISTKMLEILNFWGFRLKSCTSNSPWKPPRFF